MNFELHHNCINCTIIASTLHHSGQSHRNLQAQLKTAQATTQPKFLIELAKPTQKKNCF